VASVPVPFKSVLYADHITAIGDFARATGLEIMFALNAGWGVRNEHGAWMSGEARTLLQHVKKHALPFRVFELGNEPNAYPYLQKGLVVTPEQFAADFFALSAVRDELLPRALLAIPGTAWFPSIGEIPMLDASALPPRLEGGFQRRALVAAERRAVPDILTWHYYPGQSDRAIGLNKWRDGALISLTTWALGMISLLYMTRGRPTRQRLPCCLLTLLTAALILHLLLVAAIHVVVTPVTAQTLTTPSMLDVVTHWGKQVSENARLVESPKRRPQVWLGETGSAQAGGQAGVSGRWAATLWWLDQLGALSQLEHRVQCRQTLSGSDYGLLNEATLEPTSEFWASVLWRRLMGTAVYAVLVEGAPPTLRVYCHSSRRASGRSCLLLNLAMDAIVVSWDGLSPSGVARLWRRKRPAQVWVLEAPSLDAVLMTINGVRPEAQEGGMIPNLPGSTAAALNSFLSIPPMAAAFVKIP